MSFGMSRLLRCAGIVLGVVVCVGVPAARANVLVDPGYELNPLDTASNVLNFFNTYQGVWGVENATIVGAENGVTPFQGVKMLRMVDDGAITTQGFQTTDVSAYSGIISTGTASINMNAEFNVDKAVPAAFAAVVLQFFSGPSYGSQIGSYIASGLTLDSNPNTWENISLTGTIPVGTTWILSQVYYGDTSLIGIDGASHPGYVDAASTTITPEPASFGLFALGSGALLRRRNRAA